MREQKPICVNCGAHFRVSEDDAPLFKRFVDGELPAVVITCTECGRSTMQQRVGEDPPDAAQYCCPAPHCTGWAILVPGEDNLFGCGECGNVWQRGDEFEDAIARIIDRFPYRAKAYRKGKSGYEPVPLEELPDDYADKVETEPFE